VNRSLLIGCVVLASVTGACGGGSDNNATSATTTSSASGGTTVALVASGFAFDKTDLTAKAGETVTFELRNADGTKHNLTIADLKVNTDVEAGKTGRATATPKAGTYEFHCEYHPDKMKGTLTVS
jgi:plastocyanin